MLQIIPQISSIVHPKSTLYENRFYTHHLVGGYYSASLEVTSFQYSKIIDYQ